MSIKNAAPYSQTNQGRCTTWLRGLLCDGPRSRQEIEALGQDMGFSRASIDRARLRLPIATRRDGFAGPAIWTLVEDN